MTKNFKLLREKRSAEGQKRARALAQKYRVEMALDELREAREMTQQHLATLLGVNQAAVSKMERRTDMYVSTLRAMIQAMGGHLEIVARFPEGTVRVGQFKELRATEKQERDQPDLVAAD